jgi:xanthosine utilization system XapX-like protein
MLNDTTMNTGVMIRVTIVFTWVIIVLAGCGVGRFYDLVVQGWPALAALLGIMIGGKTMERVKELHVGAAVAETTKDGEQ